MERYKCTLNKALILQKKKKRKENSDAKDADDVCNLESYDLCKNVLIATIVVYQQILAKDRAPSFLRRQSFKTFTLPRITSSFPRKA